MMYLSDILLVFLGFVAGILVKAVYRIPDDSYDVGYEMGKQEERERIIKELEKVKQEEQKGINSYFECAIL